MQRVLKHSSTCEAHFSNAFTLGGKSFRRSLLLGAGVPFRQSLGLYAMENVKIE